MTDQNAAEEKQSDKRPANWANIGILFSTIAIVIFVCAFGYGYFQLSQASLGLAESVNELQRRAADNQGSIAALQKSIGDMQQIAQKSQDLAAQQEQVMAEWRAAQKGDLNKWHVAEAQYLAKLAEDHLQFSHDINTAVLLLQQADKVMQGVQDENLNEIRKSLASDLVSLQALPQVDVTSLFNRLSAINHQLDQLPLPVSPLKADEKQSAAAIPSGLPWWKAGIEYSRQVLSKIVIVRYNNSSALPLVMPDEKIFLYQNLHAQLESAIWALLHRNADVYQASLTNVSSWVQTYFAKDAQETRSMLQNLDELRKVNVAPSVINLSNTLQLFDNYFAQAAQTNATQ